MHRPTSDTLRLQENHDQSSARPVRNPNANGLALLVTNHARADHQMKAPAASLPDCVVRDQTLMGKGGLAKTRVDKRKVVFAQLTHNSRGVLNQTDRECQKPGAGGLPIVA